MVRFSRRMFSETYSEESRNIESRTQISRAQEKTYRDLVHDNPRTFYSNQGSLVTSPVANRGPREIERVDIGWRCRCEVIR